MPAFITLDSVSAAAPDGRVLFDTLNLSVGAERVGLVGRNGAGKSTLLALIAGARGPLAGTIARTGTIGVLDQTPELAPDAILADRLGVGAAWRRLARIEAGQGDEADFAEADWTLPARLDEALAEVGLTGLDPDRPASALSGGQQTRAGLAALLVAAPDLILLDEPTNHLDAQARDLVAQVLARWKGGAIVASHDRTLLRGMDRIVELSSLGAASYGGGYDLYAERKAAERDAAGRALDTAERDERRAARDAQAALERKARRDAAGKRFAAKGSEPKILLGARAERAENTGGKERRLAERLQGDAREAVESAERRVERARTLGFDLPPTGLPTGRLVLSMEDVAFAWPGRPPVLEGVSLRLAGPERVAVRGSNGAGKSTLLNLAAGVLAPTVGAITRGVPAVMLDQSLAILRPDETLLQAFLRLHPAADRNAAQAALARFLFRNSAADRTAGSLSGGERLRAALACVLAGPTPPQLLILDEPTNHLDLDSVAAVEAALAGYDGALLVVSHDADFLDALGVEREIDL
ncbi:ABC-F family ATP-binding cassette domain-containing protein [Caulobacter hibisci]|uniref:ABC-F family ATP-binding cassette domain-containing protein n=1 Tax=Caulobacter hibisci TaxID=2035993 RepID=A0ABS0SZS5_9CAUL|nr:ABC-F family ATP-binding cassette domain-containing protein [Caulobacter hibisci]MBI1685137.1 ABC-F family ATP-binding cassette domain-containing protein [Caulobacter hibisci]